MFNSSVTTADPSHPWQDGGMRTLWLSQEEIEGDEWLNLLNAETLLVLGAVLLVLLLVAVLVAWIVVRRLRRNPKVRGWVGDLRTKAQPAGPMRDLSELRARLRDIRGRASTAVAQAEDSGAWRSAPADLPTLARRLDESAADLDARMARYEGQPEHRVSEALPELRKQVDLMEQSEGTLHRGLDLAALPSDTASIEQLQQEMDDEVYAMEEYRKAYRDFGDGKS